jgi:hypothetical protein
MSKETAITLHEPSCCIAPARRSDPAHSKRILEQAREESERAGMPYYRGRIGVDPSAANFRRCRRSTVPPRLAAGGMGRLGQ